MRLGGRKVSKPRRKVMRRRNIRRNIRRNRNWNSEFASAKQTIQLPNDTVNTVYSFDSLSLSNFDRMVQIARAYQYYRVTKIEMKFKPFADTFAPNNGIATIPYFYWLINRGNSLQINSFNALRDAGAKPIRFDEKTVNVRYKPSVHLLTADVSGSTIFPSYNMSKISPWLATNQYAGQGGTTWSASETEHYGLLYGAEVDNFQGEPQPFGVEVTAHFQFKKPLNAPGRTSESSVVKKVVARDEV